MSDQKADAAREAVSAASRGELVTTEHKGLAALVDLQQSEIAKALPMNMDPVRFVRIVHTLLRETPKLLECSPPSFFGAVFSAAQLGLEFGVMQQAFILPYGKQAKLIIGYKGWTALAHRTGEIQSISPRTIFEKEQWSVEFGLEEKLIHVPLLSDDKGEPTHFYVVVRTVNGGRNFVIMSKSEVEYHRDRYGGKRDGKVIGPWADKDQFEPMAWKTCFLRMKAWLPTSVELMQAEAVDNHVVNQEFASDEPEILDESYLDDEGEPIVEAEILDDDQKWVRDASGGNSPDE